MADLSELKMEVTYTLISYYFLNLFFNFFEFHPNALIIVLDETTTVRLLGSISNSKGDFEKSSIRETSKRIQRFPPP